MSNENSNENEGFQIELSPDVAQGVYSNLAIITHSSSEFVMDYVRILPGVPKAQVKSRVILAPEHAKRLLYALQENVAKYEKVYGTIRMPQQEPRTVAPFGNNKGEA